MLDEKWPPESMLDMMTKLSDADISVLKAAVAHRDAKMTTAFDSGNHRLWTKLAEFGLLKDEGPISLKEDPRIPQGALANIRVFSVVQEELPQLEMLLEKYRVRLIYGKINHFLQTECEQISARIVEGVKNAGGSQPDLIILMGLLVTKVIGKSCPRDDYEKMVQGIADVALKWFKGLPPRTT